MDDYALIQADQTSQLIAQADIHQALDYRHRLEALRRYAKQAGAGIKEQNRIAELRQEAQWKAGDLLITDDTILTGSGNHKKIQNFHNESFKTLSDLDISPMQSHYWQKFRNTFYPFDKLKKYQQAVKDSGEELTDAALYRLAGNGLNQPMQVLLSHKEVEYYTPSQYIEAARQVMGEIDLDPASCEEAQFTVKAKQFYDASMNGLTQSWYGRVWLNPPYSKTDGKSNQQIWALKLIDEHVKGNVSQGVLLVKSALGYNWFEELWDLLPVCFVRERLSFTKSDGSSDGQSKHGTALFYVGQQIDDFVSVFSQFGKITLPDGRYVNEFISSTDHKSL